MSWYVTTNCLWLSVYSSVLDVSEFPCARATSNILILSKASTNAKRNEGIDFSKDTTLNEHPDRKKECYVDIIVHGVPESLVKDFGEKILKACYLSGISPAIKDLMKQAVEGKLVPRKVLRMDQTNRSCTRTFKRRNERLNRIMAGLVK